MFTLKTKNLFLSLSFSFLHLNIHTKLRKYDGKQISTSLS